jgi:hypothetical protein
VEAESPIYQPRVAGVSCWPKRDAGYSVLASTLVAAKDDITSLASDCDESTCHFFVIGIRSTYC